MKTALSFIAISGKRLGGRQAYVSEFGLGFGVELLVLRDEHETY